MPEIVAVTQRRKRPIPFSTPMVLAERDGRKSQTRRVVSLHGNDGIQELHEQWRFCEFHDSPRRAVWQHVEDIKRVITESCPYGIAGDLLWVREAWVTEKRFDGLKPSELPADAQIFYLADGAKPEWAGRYRNSRFMPERISRRWLEVTSIRVERLLNISEADALAEGIRSRPDAQSPYTFTHRPEDDFLEIEGPIEMGDSARAGYQILWNLINGDESWALNPWVWVVTFKRVEVLHG